MILVEIFTDIEMIVMELNWKILIIGSNWHLIGQTRINSVKNLKFWIEKMKILISKIDELHTIENGRKHTVVMAPTENQRLGVGMSICC